MILRLSSVKKSRIFAVGTAVLASAVVVLYERPPVALVYTVWNALPASAVDQDGRVGRLYTNGSNVLYVVVFERNYHPRHGGTLDRFLIPSPSDRGIYAQITFDPNTLRSGTGNSDEVFDDFLLSRLQGVGRNGDGVVQVKSVRKNREQQFVATVNGKYEITIRSGPSHPNL